MESVFSKVCLLAFNVYRGIDGIEDTEFERATFISMCHPSNYPDYITKKLRKLFSRIKDHLII